MNVSIEINKEGLNVYKDSHLTHSIDFKKNI